MKYFLIGLMFIIVGGCSSVPKTEEEDLEPTTAVVIEDTGIEAGEFVFVAIGAYVITLLIAPIIFAIL